MKRQKTGLLLIILFITVNTYAQDWKQYIDTANTYKAQKNPGEAIQYLLKAKNALYKDSLYTQTYILTGKDIALFYLQLGYGEEAITVYEELRKIISKMHWTVTKDYADICNNLGTIYNRFGELDTAFEIHLEAKEIRRELFGDTSSSYAQSCNNLGALYRDFGYYDLAEPLLLKAKEIREKLEPAGRVPEYAITCTALANLYRDIGNYEQAEALYITAKNVREDTLGKASSSYASSCNILADLYAYMGHFDQAEQLYLEAKSVRNKPGNEDAYAETCNNLGALYRDNGQFNKGEKLLLEAKEFYENKYPEGSPNFTINYNNLGELYYAIGNYEVAESYYLMARKKWEKDLGKEHPYYIANSDEMVRLYRNDNAPLKADTLIRETSQLKFRQLNRVFQFTSETEKKEYLQNINGSADEYLSFYFTDFPTDKAGEPYNITLSYRNLILSSLQQTRQAVSYSGDASLNNIYLKWIETRQQLARLYSRGAAADTTKLKILVKGTDNMEKELSRESAMFKKIQDKPGWRDIQKKLGRNEMAIEFVEFQVYNKKLWTDSNLYVALILRDGIVEPVLVPLCEKKQLQSLIYKKNAGSGPGINQEYTSDSLYKLIWKPLEKYLSGITKIYFAPAGLLHKVSLAALTTGNKQILSDQYQMVQLLTTASILEIPETKLVSSDKIFLYGAVQYDADSSNLSKAAMKYYKGSMAKRSVVIDLTDKEGKQFFEPIIFSGREIDSIAISAKTRKFSTVILKGEDASEESVKALTEEQAPFVLHISTHGFFFPDPKKNKANNKDPIAKVFKQSDDPLFRGGLGMAGAENTWRGKPVDGLEDGVLTAYEVSNMYFPHNKLVVLSACETALGDLEGSEGVYGLQRAFKIAGTQTLVMSLWKVPDLQTAEFMQLFYKNMFNNNSISDAFYKTQEVLKNKYRSEPYNWAAWVMVR